MESSMTRIITTVLTIFIITLVTSYALKQPKKKVERDINGETTLRIAKFGLYIGYFSLVFGVLLLSGGFILIQYTFDAIFMIPFSISFLLCGIFFILQDKNKKFIFSDKKVACYTIFGNKREVYWTEVNKVTISSLTGVLLLHSGVEKVKMNCNIVGGDQFIEMMMKSLSKELYLDALKKLYKMRNNYRR